jgi:Fe-S-cluster-containing dehydrogenase component
MKLGLVIDLDTCVGCHACAVACKEWNGESLMAGGAPDYDPYGASPSGVWFNRIRHFEQVREGPRDAASGHVNLSKTINVPMSCMHCEDADCVTVCPTGASYKRAEDGIVLVDPQRCMGCNYCSWACPYGARELDAEQGVMRKCTLCVDRIYDQAPAGVRARVSGARADVRGFRRSGVRGLGGHARARRSGHVRGARLPAGEPLSAASRGARDRHLAPAVEADAEGEAVGDRQPDRVDLTVGSTR